MSFDMLQIKKDRVMEIEFQLKKLVRSQRKQLIHSLKVERANLIIEIETIEAKRAKKELNSN